MARRLIALALLAALSGCSTLNQYGIGGEPALLCKARDGTAVLDDKVAGGAQWHVSVQRRFRDGDLMCRTMLKGTLAATEAYQAAEDAGIVLVPVPAAPAASAPANAI
jgi:uncharacterized protein YceK